MGEVIRWARRKVPNSISDAGIFVAKLSIVAWIWMSGLWLNRNGQPDKLIYEGNNIVVNFLIVFTILVYGCCKSNQKYKVNIYVGMYKIWFVYFIQIMCTICKRTKSIRQWY